MIGVCIAWIILLRSMIATFTKTPYLVKTSDLKSTPKVSVILPARNEEDFLSACLDSLKAQDYPNYEIIAIDDSSTDDTPNIIARYSNDSKIVPVYARPKPDGWMGKNWACMEGYAKATGQLLLFTDADTHHSPDLISLAVAYMISQRLDALSAMPKMLTFDFWTRVTLPMISTFLHTRFSALNVNNPKKETGYFFGSFFILKRSTYDNVGRHEGVKQEIIEDGALGKKVKIAGYKMKMIRGEHLIDAAWARDRKTLWEGLKRLMIPLYSQSSKVAIGIFVAVAFLLFIPFSTVAYSIAVQLLTPNEDISYSMLTVSAGVASLMIYIGAAIETRVALGIKSIYSIFAPIGGLFVVCGFLSGILHAKSDSSVTWRDRKYTIKEYKQDSIKI